MQRNATEKNDRILHKRCIRKAVLHKGCIRDKKTEILHNKKYCITRKTNDKICQKIPPFPTLWQNYLLTIQHIKYVPKSALLTLRKARIARSPTPITTVPNITCIRMKKIDNLIL